MVSVTNVLWYLGKHMLVCQLNGLTWFQRPQRVFPSRAFSLGPHYIMYPCYLQLVVSHT